MEIDIADVIKRTKAGRVQWAPETDPLTGTWPGMFTGLDEDGETRYRLQDGEDVPAGEGGASLTSDFVDGEPGDMMPVSNDDLVLSEHATRAQQQELARLIKLVHSLTADMPRYEGVV